MVINRVSTFLGVPAPGFGHVRPILLSHKISILSAIGLTNLDCSNRAGEYWSALGQYSTVQPIPPFIFRPSYGSVLSSMACVCSRLIGRSDWLTVGYCCPEMRTGRLWACKPYNKQLINLERSVITGECQTSILPYCQLHIFAISNFSPLILAVLLSEKIKKSYLAALSGCIEPE